MLVLTSLPPSLLPNKPWLVSAYLDSGLCQAYPHGELLPHEDVRVVSLTKTSLQFIQLAGSEPGSVSFLLGIFVVESEEILVLDLPVLVVDVQPELVVVEA